MNDLKYEFKLTWPTTGKVEKIKKQGLTKDEMDMWLEYLKHKFKEDKTLSEMIEDVSRGEYGFTGRSQGAYEFTISAYVERIPTTMEHRCPRRDEMFSAASRFPGPDRWDKLGEDLICSYCGSLHPNSVLDIVSKHGAQSLEGSTKSYKLYIKRPGIHNAGMGGIKYYRHHDTEEFLNELNKIIRG